MVKSYLKETTTKKPDEPTLCLFCNGTGELSRGTLFKRVVTCKYCKGSGIFIPKTK